MSAPQRDRIEPDLEGLAAFVAGDPRLEAVRAVGSGVEAYLVGGSVRDLLMGLTPADLDLAIEGDPSTLVERLDPEATEHYRFGTARLNLQGGQVDLAATRRETYPRPGALPEVEPAGLEEDLARRDFTVNAIAVPLSRPGDLIDPFDGLSALAERRLTLLRPDSFTDDPLRALRGARYAARFDFRPDDQMSLFLKEVDLGSVSDDRLDAELSRLADEARPDAALDLARQWGLVEIDPGLVDRIAGARELLGREPWVGFCTVAEVARTALEDGDRVRAIPDLPPRDRIEQFELLERLEPGAIVLARAGGLEWLDWWAEFGAGATLDIDGDALIEAGIEPGPRVGAGLRAALAELLETGESDRDRQLETAVAAARER